jgi:hypothetical protein
MLTRPTRMGRRVLAITGLDATLTVQPVGRKWALRVAQVDLEGAT